jgi:hypothetical protein
MGQYAPDRRRGVVRRFFSFLEMFPEDLGIEILGVLKYEQTCSYLQGLNTNLRSAIVAREEGPEIPGHLPER